jgi:exodeoxyribonuclease VII large subunit
MRGERGRAAHRVELLTSALRASDPVVRVTRGRERMESLEARMLAAFRRRCDRARHRMRETVGRLDSLSPLAVLGRGYSVTRRPTGEVVRSAREVSAGDELRVLLQEGSLDTRVTDTREHDDRPQV